MTRMTVPAQDVQEDDQMVGLGYVVDVPETDPEVSMRSGRQYVHMGDGMVLVTFNNQHGEEGYLMVPQGTDVEVDR